MIGNGEGGEATLNWKLARNAERISSLRCHSNMQRDRVALVGHGLVWSSTVGMMGLHLCHVGGSRHSGTRRQRQSAELIHHRADCIRMVGEMLSMRSWDVLRAAAHLTEVRLIGGMPTVSHV